MSASHRPSVDVRETRYGPDYIYNVYVDGKPYDQMVSSRFLTWSEQDDLASGYQEALDNYDQK